MKYNPLLYVALLFSYCSYCTTTENHNSCRFALQDAHNWTLLPAVYDSMKKHIVHI